MIFAAKYKLESKSCPGVTVTLRRMGPKLRAETELKVASGRAKYREITAPGVKLSAELQGILDEVPGYRDAVKALPRTPSGELIDNLPPEINAMVPRRAWDIATERAEIAEHAMAVERVEIAPAFLIAAVVSIEGLTAEDETPYTVQMLLESGPDELFDEVNAAILANGTLPAEKAGNLSLPTTSAEQGDGGPTSTTA